MKIIPNNHVFLKPDLNFVDQLYPFLEGTIISPIDRHLMHCTILYSDKPLENFVPSEALYSAKILGAEYWYDKYAQTTDLILHIDSPALLQRQQDIMREYGVDSVYDTPYFHIGVSYNVPPKSEKYRRAFNSFTNMVNDFFRGKVINLSHEAIGSSAGFLQVKQSMINPTSTETTTRDNPNLNT